jgi:hypothetical protein
VIAAIPEAACRVYESTMYVCRLEKMPTAPMANGNSMMGMIQCACRPAIPEEGDRDKWGKEDADGEAHFQVKVLLLPVVVATLQVPDYAVAEKAEGCLAP